MYDVFYSFNILNTSFNIGFCITVKRLEQSWFVRYINVYYYYYYYHLTPSSFHRVLFFCVVSVSFESCSCILYSPTQAVVDALVDPNRTYRLVVIHGPLGICTSLACHTVLVTVGWVGEGWIETHLNIEIITLIDY